MWFLTPLPETQIDFYHRLESVRESLLQEALFNTVKKAHNRLGEAEKSHQKAKLNGFTEFWTLIGTTVIREIANKESPTTDKFYYIPNLINNKSYEYVDFKENLIALAGIADQEE